MSIMVQQKQLYANSKFHIHQIGFLISNILHQLISDTPNNEIESIHELDQKKKK